jgi:alpha-tubulin suppressor-like RCC1 family protein
METLVKVAAGGAHSLVISAAGRVYSWGTNSLGQLGDATTNDAASPVAVFSTGISVLSGKNITAIAAGRYFSVALDSTGNVFTWGADSNGQLGIGTTTAFMSSPIAVDTTGVLNGKFIKDVAAGAVHTVVLSNDGQVFTFGCNDNGQLGATSVVGNSKVPVALDIELAFITAISAGAAHTVALAQSGALFAWGSNLNGQLGDGTVTTRQKPVLVLTVDKQIVSIAYGCGASHTAIIANTCQCSPQYTGDACNIPICYGIPATSQTACSNGNGTCISPDVCHCNNGYCTFITGYNINILDGSQCEAWHCGISIMNSTTVCSGNGACVAPDSCLCNPGYVDSTCQSWSCSGVAMNSTAVCSANGACTGVNNCTCNYSYYGSYCQNFDCTIFFPNTSSQASSALIPLAFGYNTRGQCGDGSTDNRNSSVYVNIQGVLKNANITAFSLGATHTVALANTPQLSGQVFTWGGNDYGQLGDGTNQEYLTPIAVQTSGVLKSKVIVAISAGSSHTIAISSDGLVFSWGGNDQGQLGDGTTTFRLTPVAVDNTDVLGHQNIISGSAGAYHTVVCSDSGAVFDWGGNSNYQLGNGENTDRVSPIAVNMSGVLNGKMIKAVAASYTRTVVLSQDGLIFAWGVNILGDLGDGSMTLRSTPVAITVTGKTFIQIAVGMVHTIALATDGTIYTWGQNAWGQLGHIPSSGITELSPHAVLGSAGTGVMGNKLIISIAAGQYHSTALSADGSWFSWGSNQEGQLGDGTFTLENYPVLVQNAGASKNLFITSIAGGSTAHHSMGIAKICSPCKPGYSGSSCQNFVCYGVSSEISAVCGNGTCTALDVCTCNAGYCKPIYFNLLTT